jgi:hypothetical protein
MFNRDSASTFRSDIHPLPAGLAGKEQGRAIHPPVPAMLGEVDVAVVGRVDDITPVAKFA